MKKSIIPLLLLVLILCISLVSSAPPSSIVLSGTNTLVIATPTREYIPINSNYTFHVHVYDNNLSALNNTRTNCAIHLYGLDGEHILNQKMVKDPLFPEDHEVLIDGKKNLSQPGEYAWLVWCNSTIPKLTGETRGELIVTRSGYDNSNLPMMSIAIMIALFSLTLIFAGATAYFDNELKLFFLLLTTLNIVFDLNVLANLASDMIMQDSIINLLWLGYKVSLWLLLFIFFWVIYKLFASLKMSKKTAIETDNNSLMKKLPK